MLHWISDFFLAIVRIYKVAYLRNFECNINHKYEKDIGYKSDIAILYQKIESENLGRFRCFFREGNIVIDV